VPCLKHLIISGGALGGLPAFERLIEAASPVLHASDTHKDDPAFWLYSSGSTGPPKGIAPYKYPRWIEFIPELPKTATGKIQRFRLR
jgi:acyl-coenzyme A synthetase/AMP-(fatty) acid ligase